MNVLLVDDEPMMIEQLKMMIEPMCPLWNLYTAADGSQAMHLSEEMNIQLAFLDIEMPGKSGLELAQELKKKFPNIEIVIITAHQDFNYAKQSIKVGVAEYLTKPLIESELREIIKRFANDVDFMEYSQIILSALHIVHEEYDEALNLSNVARKIHVNPSYLSRKFSDEVGQSFSEYVTNYRVEMAKNLLKKNKGVSISDIAEQVGFNRLHYFSTIFKKKLGMSPKEFRERSDKRLNGIRQQKQSLGIGVTTVYLLERWMTPFALFVGAEASLHYGVLAGFLFAIIGLIIFMSFSVILLQIKKRTPQIGSLTDWLSYKMTDSGRSFFFIILYGLYSLDIFIVGLGGGVLWYAGFHIPMVVGTGFSLLLLYVIYWVMGEKDWGRIYHIYILGFFFAILVFSLVYPFLVNPLQAIYDGMRLYHPYLFVIQEKELIIYVLAIFTILMGRIMISPSSWKLAESQSKMKIRSTFFLAGAIWATLPIAFSTLLYPVISQGMIGRIEEVFLLVTNIIPSQIVKYLFLFIIGVILVRSGKHVVESMKLQHHGFSSMNRVISVSVIVIAYSGYVIWQPTLLDWFFLIGILYASLLLPVFIMVISQFTVGWIFPLSFILSNISGMVVHILEGPFAAIGTSVTVSGLTFLIYWSYKV